MPDHNWYRHIHAQLLAGDPAAPAELAHATWQPLVAKLRQKHPRLKHTDLLVDAASDALVAYIKQPRQFDPQRRGLFGFLVMAAEGDLRNELAKISRRRRTEELTDNVELPAFRGKERPKAADPSAKVELQRLRARIHTIFKDPRDREAVETLLDGERSTTAFATIWGLEGLSVKQQAIEVKRHKDRIQKVLQRHRGSSQ